MQFHLRNRGARPAADGDVLESGGPERGRRGQVSHLIRTVPANPAGVLEKLAPLKFQDEKMRFVVLKRIVVELAAIDVEEAAAVAETIADAGTLAGILADRRQAAG